MVTMTSKLAFNRQNGRTYRGTVVVHNAVFRTAKMTKIMKILHTKRKSRQVICKLGLALQQYVFYLDSL